MLRSQTIAALVASIKGLNVNTTRTETIESSDDQRFDAYLALPRAGHGAGVLLIQEIFGIDGYIKDVATRLSGLGYVVLAPDVFWRQEPGFTMDSSDEANIEPAAKVAAEWDPTVGLSDLEAAFRHLESLPEVTGATGVIGFCFGGTQAFRVAKSLNPSCAVSYYGSGVATLLDDLHEITCPTVLHFGDNDPFIPDDDIAAIKGAVAGNNHVVVHVHPGGGHAFDNHSAAHFSQPDIAAKAWTETAAFLYMHLGGPGLGA